VSAHQTPDLFCLSRARAQAIDFVRGQRDDELWEQLMSWALGSPETTGEGTTGPETTGEGTIGPETTGEGTTGPETTGEGAEVPSVCSPSFGTYSHAA